MFPQPEMSGGKPSGDEDGEKALAEHPGRAGQEITAGFRCSHNIFVTAASVSAQPVTAPRLGSSWQGGSNEGLMLMSFNEEWCLYGQQQGAQVCTGRHWLVHTYGHFIFPPFHLAFLLC